jgi:hypothetical protein
MSNYVVSAEMAAKYAHEKLTRGASNWKDFRFVHKNKRLLKEGSGFRKGATVTVPDDDMVTARLVTHVQKSLSDFVTLKERKTPNDVAIRRTAGIVYFSMLPKIYNVAHALRVAEEAIFCGAGNCGEFAAVVFSYLYKRNVLPLDIMSSTLYDHGWVVIGRPAGTDPANPVEWLSKEENAFVHPVICDPWMKHGSTPYNKAHEDKMVTELDDGRACKDYTRDYIGYKVEVVLRVDKRKMENRKMAFESPF